MPIETVYISELERAILKVFIDHQIIDKQPIISALLDLIDKVGK